MMVMALGFSKKGQPVNTREKMNNRIKPENESLIQTKITMLLDAFTNAFTTESTEKIHTEECTQRIQTSVCIPLCSFASSAVNVLALACAVKIKTS